MNGILFELELSKKRLDYYNGLKSQFIATREEIARGLTSVKKGRARKESPEALDKWIEIYADRVKRLERQASKLGKSA